MGLSHNHTTVPNVIDASCGQDLEYNRKSKRRRNSKEDDPSSMIQNTLCLLHMSEDCPSGRIPRVHNRSRWSGPRPTLSASTEGINHLCQSLFARQDHAEDHRGLFGRKRQVNDRLVGLPTLSLAHQPQSNRSDRVIRSSTTSP